MKLKTKKRFRELHRQQSKDERKHLEDAIIEEGRVRDAIVIMQGDVILDGHNRYDIATKHSLSFDVLVKHFDSDDEAEKWILREQLGRRNLSPHDFKITLGRYYNSEKKGEGRPKRGQNDPVFEPTRTAEKVAEESGVSEATVKRAGKRAEAFDQLASPAKKLINEKPSRATDKAVIALAKKTTAEQQQIARDVRTGQKQTFDEALGLKKNNKPPKQYPRSHWMKQWNSAMGPIVRLVDKISKEVGEPNCSSHRAVHKHLNNATDVVSEWMGGKK